MAKPLKTCPNDITINTSPKFLYDGDVSTMTDSDKKTKKTKKTSEEKSEIRILGNLPTSIFTDTSWTTLVQ